MKRASRRTRTTKCTKPKESEHPSQLTRSADQPTMNHRAPEEPIDHLPVGTQYSKPMTFQIHLHVCECSKIAQSIAAARSLQGQRVRLLCCPALRTLFLCRLNTTSNKNTSPSDGRRAMDQQGYIWPAPASGAPVSPHPSRPRPLLHAACLPRTIYTKPSGCAALLTTNPAIRHPVDAARASPCVSCACASHPLTPPSRRPLHPGRLLLPALRPGPLASRKRHTPMLERATHEQPRAHRAAAKRGGAAERRLDGAGQPDEMHAARLQQGSARRRRAIL